ncbi:MAG: 30S ribosomal protein S16 [Planctomycetota bacterium]
MAVAIRLKRTGRRRRPFYRIEAIERRNSRSGRGLEILGTYDPLVQKPTDRVKMKLERIQHWVEQGARPSVSVLNFLRTEEIAWGASAGKKKPSRKKLQRKRRAAKRAQTKKKS